MIKKQHWLIALLIAFSLHAAAFISFASTNKLDAAKDDGKSGIEIDLGMLGDLGTATAEPVAEEEPEPEVQPPKVIEPKPVKPDPIPEPVKLDPKPVVQKNDVHIKKQVKTPKVEKKIPKEKPTPVEQKIVAAEKKSYQKATTSTNTTRDKKASTGSQNTISTGAQKAAERSYFAELSAKLARHKRYPSRSRRLHEEGIAVLFIAVNRDGTVSNSYISKSSGYPKLDDAVLRMLKKASPLPAFPDDMKQANLSINIPIDFKLSDRH